MKSTAPASSALRTSSPASLATLTMTMGTGARAICSRTNPTPSRFGMIRSQVTTSGFSSTTRSSASCPSRAVPTTSRNGLRVKIWVTTFRTYAESSTTRTRVTLLFVISSCISTFHVDKGPIEIVEHEPIRHAQQRFGRPDEQIPRRRHLVGQNVHDLLDAARREIDERIAAEDHRAARMRRHLLTRHQIDDTPRRNAPAERRHRLRGPAVRDEVFLPQLRRQ